MKRKKFFENIGNIMIFGLVVTLVCFTIYSAASYGAQEFGFSMYNYVTGNGPNPVKIPTM